VGTDSYLSIGECEITARGAYRIDRISRVGLILRNISCHSYISFHTVYQSDFLVIQRTILANLQKKKLFEGH
jgi:hypothetical protein